MLPLSYKVQKQKLFCFFDFCGIYCLMPNLTDCYASNLKGLFYQKYDADKESILCVRKNKSLTGCNSEWRWISRSWFAQVSIFLLVIVFVVVVGWVFNISLKTCFCFSAETAEEKKVLPGSGCSHRPFHPHPHHCCFSKKMNQASVVRTITHTMALQLLTVYLPFWLQ